MKQEETTWDIPVATSFVANDPESTGNDYDVVLSVETEENCSRPVKLTFSSRDDDGEIEDTPLGGPLYLSKRAAEKLMAALRQAIGKKKQKALSKPVCSYCGLEATLCTGREIYPNRGDLERLKFWKCETCRDVYVGCYKGTNSPMGTLANQALRKARMIAHQKFDRIWREDHDVSRDDAYAWLGRRLGLSQERCHIGMFDLATCRLVEALVDSLEPVQLTENLTIREIPAIR
jgi:hypothetical protein